MPLMSGLKVLCFDPTGTPAWGFYNSLLVRGSVGVKAKLIVVERSRAPGKLSWQILRGLLVLLQCVKIS